MSSLATVADLAASIASGRIESPRLIDSYLQRIETGDKAIGAWAFLDLDLARGQAARLDEWRRSGRPLGPLHGIPVGLADTFDTMDMPAEDGTILHSGRRPRIDSAVASLLRQAGAIILGKTAISELGLGGTGATRNPHDPRCIAGTSSSGSAAAVAAGMVPLAIGLQSGGSLIQSAAYCGVVGYKPSHGSISRSGSLRLSRTLDQPGIFAANVIDAALLAEILMAYEPADGDMTPQAKPELSRLAANEPPLPPRLGFMKTFDWEQAQDDTRSAFAELVEFLGEAAEETPMPSILENGPQLYKMIFEADAAVALKPEYDQGRDKLDSRSLTLIEQGERVLAADYIRATARIGLLRQAMAEHFEHYDAVITLSAAGEAPQEGDAEAESSPVWTLMGAPAITLPLLQGSNGLPIGVQLVGQCGEDGRLLRTANWLSNLLSQGERKGQASRRRSPHRSGSSGTRADQPQP